MYVLIFNLLKVLLKKKSITLIFSSIQCEIITLNI